MALGDASSAAGYEQLELLARGGTADIYRAIDAKSNEAVALKVLLPALAGDRTARARIRREAALLRQYSHVGLPRLHAELSEPLGLVLELIVGQSLSQQLAVGNRLSAAKILTVYEGLLATLDFLHGHGVVHRDIKPGNIMILDAPAESVVKLIDWGLASRIKPLGRDDKLTRSGTPIGTPLYMSPEHCQGRGINEKSDVYCLGLVLFEMLSGHPPFSGVTPVEVMMKQLTQPIPDWQAGDDAEHLLYAQARCMTHKDPLLRPAISTLRDALRQHPLRREGSRLA